MRRRQATAVCTQLTDPNFQRFSFLSAGDNHRRDADGPGRRQSLPAHRLGRVGQSPVDRQPTEQQRRGAVSGLPEHRVARQPPARLVHHAAIGAVGKRLVSEAIVGFSDFQIRFDTNFRVKDIDTFSGDALGSNQGGFSLGINARRHHQRDTLDVRLSGSTQSLRADLEHDDLEQGIAQSVAFGGSLQRRSAVSSSSKALVPTITFGVDSSDPAQRSLHRGQLQRRLRRASSRPPGICMPC